MNILKKYFKEILQNTPVHDILEQRSIRRWYDHKQQSVQSIEQAIQAIQDRWAIYAKDDPEYPVFILASGWRSGSTLLQRLVNSDENILLWGEPFSDSNIVQDMANSLRPFHASYPPDYNFIQSKNFTDNSSPLSQRWTANLYPEADYLFQAHRAFFLHLYAKPAQHQNYSRWGFKEVRLTIDHAIYLKWLFPNARFLFLYRNPYKAYQSCYGWRRLYLHWPDDAVFSPEQFGQLWLNQVTGFLQAYKKVDGFLIKYEDLCSKKELIDGISSYLKAHLECGVLESRIGASSSQNHLPKHHLKRLERIVSPLAETLGYFPTK